MFAATSTARASSRPAATVDKLQAIVDALRSQLEVPQEVKVVLVAKNPLMASVEPAKKGNAFVLSIERGFASRLSDDELKGVLAHELGHVWIFTHHPYLQTEQLANRIAMRLVSRDNLERVYEKVWKDGAKGDLARFLGEAPSQGVVAAAATTPAGKPPAAGKEADGPLVRQ